MGSVPDKTVTNTTNMDDLGYTPNIKVSEPWTVEKAMEHVDKGKSFEGTPIAFFHILERLKTTKREGWRRFGINRGESIADHMYRMSLISMFAPPTLAPKLDMAKCMKMCLIHDMAELLVGDITPVDGVPKPEKSRRETTTMEYLTKTLLGGVHSGVTGEHIMEIWQEYEDSQTLDSHFVHDVDKIELLLQMNEYERRSQRAIDLGEFAWVSNKVTLPEMKEWAAALVKEREEFWAGQTTVHGQKGVDGGLNETETAQRDEYYKRD